MGATSFRIFPSSGVPIYRQLMDQVRSQVAGNVLRSGEMLPSVREVAEDLEVNPMTVSKAYSLLEREGFLELVRGQGMRVRQATVGGSLTARMATLEPLLDQVATQACHLGLPPGKVLARLSAKLEDKQHG
jgi:GntR family transcriptional regulator